MALLPIYEPLCTLDGPVGSLKQLAIAVYSPTHPATARWSLITSLCGLQQLTMIFLRAVPACDSMPTPFVSVFYERSDLPVIYELFQAYPQYLRPVPRICNLSTCSTHLQPVYGLFSPFLVCNTS
ncbi:hypothetical protein O6H91_16G063300 [Diphasiastrum complanatum]|uniref:Uncharacterized protein n=1 Tax=Diphasiastrum complanatum TaxID=34168 RepID=A0ACC2BCZ1_DIPCM|nr:hypothetical protein O6H91_16G063300 [Diphasiastrum complanatum]